MQHYYIKTSIIVIMIPGLALIFLSGVSAPWLRFQTKMAQRMIFRHFPSAWECLPVADIRQSKAEKIPTQQTHWQTIVVCLNCWRIITTQRVNQHTLSKMSQSHQDTLQSIRLHTEPQSHQDILQSIRLHRVSKWPSDRTASN